MNESLEKLKDALFEWLCHLIALTVLLVSFWLIEHFTSFLWEDKLFFGKFPMSYFFDAADAVLLLGFLFYGIASFMKVYARVGK